MLGQAAAILAKSGLSKAELGRLWALADADRDGKLCRHEFALAVHLAACAVGKDGLPLPATLPPCLASATAAVAAAASDEGGENKEETVEGRMILVDESNSVVSSLGYPEGLSDIEGSEKGDVVSAGDNTPRKETSPPEMEERKERDFQYTMSDKDTVRYGEVFDKLVKGKRTENLGGTEVRISVCSCALNHSSLRACCFERNQRIHQHGSTPALQSWLHHSSPLFASNAYTMTIKPPTQSSEAGSGDSRQIRAGESGARPFVGHIGR